MVNKKFIRGKTLELIAKEIGNLDTSSNLVRFLESCGVDKEIITHSDINWKMVFDVLMQLASSNKQEDQDALSKIIGEATSPLIHNGNKKSAYALRRKFNDYLKYDNRGIAYDEQGRVYLALRNASSDEVSISDSQLLYEKGAMPIKDIQLDDKNYLLKINKGDKIISFKSKKGEDDLEKETKQFKILYQLWDFRRETKGSRITEQGDYVSLGNLTKGSGSKNTESTYKHIQRLNKRFRENGLAIQIKGKDGKYRLIIRGE